MAPIASASTDYPGYIFAALLVAGGALGFFRRGSIISLAMGSLAAIAQFYGAQRVSANSRDVWPALYTNIALCALMSYRFANSNKFMPSGLISLLSLVSLCRYAILAAV